MKIYVHSEPLHNWDSKFTQNCPKKKITPGNNADVLKQVSGQTKQKGDTAYHAILLSNEKGNELLIHTQCR